MTHLRRGRMWSLTQNQPVKPSEALPEQLDLLIIAGPSQLNYSILIKKKETIQLHLIKLFTKQSVSENNSFHLPALCRPVLGLVWTSGFEKEHDKQTSDVHWWIFTIWRKNILVLASVICLPGNFQFNLKQSTDQKGWHRHRETHTVLLTSFIFFLPPFCSSVNLFSYWRESVDRRCACEDEKRVSKVQKMLFKVIVHLI